MTLLEFLFAFLMLQIGFAALVVASIGVFATVVTIVIQLAG